MSEKIPKREPFPPGFHLGDGVEAPNQWSEWAFRRHVPPADYLVEQIKAENDVDGIVGEIIQVLDSGQQVTWERADDLMAQLHHDDGYGLRDISAAVQAASTGRKGSSAAVQKAKAWRGVVDAYIANLRKTDPDLFKMKRDVIVNVQRWAADRVDVKVSDGTLQNYLYTIL